MLFYGAIVFLPLLGSLIAGLGGYYGISTRVSEFVTCIFMVTVAALSWIAFFAIGFQGIKSLRIPIMQWVTSSDLTFNWAFRIDTLTAVMLVVVSTVSALVHIYSIGYMRHDSGCSRFFAYLSLFTFMMLMLVTANNLLQVFFGWEGVGFVSYLLIGFWYQRLSANRAAMKAFIINRIGDFSFLLGIFGIFMLFDSVDFDVLFLKVALGQTTQKLHFLNWDLDQQNALNIVCLLLFVGAMGKSAQFLLHTWLPDAMEGPTPVSALIHAATMVTAGVFMVARMSPIFEFALTACGVITFIGATTAFFAATVGLVQNDIKRVIAYSTCSQLGYMFVALGVGAYGASVFHLFTHAFFKALLFLGAGSVIHAVSGEQDMRRMGGLRKYVPMTYWMMIIGTLALTGVGIPGTLIGTSGFFSKDAIIESAFVGSNVASEYAFWLLVITAFLTSFYSWRLIFMVFHGKIRATADIMHHVCESPPVMLVPLLLLAAGALFIGIVFQPFFFGKAYHHFWNDALFTAVDNNIMEAIHHVPLWVEWLPFFLITIGFFMAFLFYILIPSIPERLSTTFSTIYKFLLNKWYFDELYNLLFVRTTFAIGNFFWKIGDGKIIDGFGPNGVAAWIIGITNKVVRMQTGYLYHYVFVMMIGITGLVTWMMIRSLN
ncbi:MAG: NADH-quinone oxidoreductase subunit L [Candidatus Tokpelaia sp. JSC188]|nr:MAG: NADH-quinone oxidoreductase subunit L [Candidatus Tokpelaia sp. JSC188]